MNNVKSNFKKDLVEQLIPFARKDPRYFLLICDNGFGVIDKFKTEFPHRIINAGIMEQGTVGIAAGMAMTGLIPIVYSIANFLAFRAIEQVRNDVVKQGLNVKLVGVGTQNYFKFLGSSHCCDEDDKKIMELIGIRVFDPTSDSEKSFPQLVEEWITDPHPGYFRA